MMNYMSGRNDETHTYISDMSNDFMWLKCDKLTLAADYSLIKSDSQRGVDLSKRFGAC